MQYKFKLFIYMYFPSNNRCSHELILVEQNMRFNGKYFQKIFQLIYFELSQSYIIKGHMRSILKQNSLGLVRSLNKFGIIRPIFSFATEAPMKIESFKFSKKHELPVECYTENYQAIVKSRSCQTLAFLIRDNCRFWLDYHLKHLYIHMRHLRMTPTQQFYVIISPFSIEFLKQFTRDQATTMYEMLRCLIQLNIYDKPLMDMLIQKLDNQNCYKYIPLISTGVLLDTILSNPKHQAQLNSLTRKLIAVVYQQREYYNSFKETRNLMGGILKKIEGLKLDGLQLEDVDARNKLQ